MGGAQTQWVHEQGTVQCSTCTNQSTAVLNMHCSALLKSCMVLRCCCLKVSARVCGTCMPHLLVPAQPAGPHTSLLARSAKSSPALQTGACESAIATTHGQHMLQCTVRVDSRHHPLHCTVVGCYKLKPTCARVQCYLGWSLPGVDYLCALFGIRGRNCASHADAFTFCCCVAHCSGSVRAGDFKAHLDTLNVFLDRRQAANARGRDDGWRSSYPMAALVQETLKAFCTSVDVAIEFKHLPEGRCA